MKNRFAWVLLGPLFIVLSRGKSSFEKDVSSTVNLNPATSNAVSRQSNEADIYEAVFRHQFDHNASGQQKNANVYCLSVGEANVDPTSELVERFAGNIPPVRKASECAVKGGVADRRSGKQGLMFRVTNIIWMSSRVVMVSGGYYEGVLSASGNTYTVEQLNGKWVVTKDHIGWIS